jgi:type IV pilus assembly protein PilE
MIVVVVISILASIAFPSYREQMMKGQRADARALLYEVLQKQERFYTENNTYTTSLTALGYPAALKTRNDAHNITMAAGASGAIATSVNIVATAASDAKCATMTLANTQLTTATGTDPTTCW